MSDDKDRGSSENPKKGVQFSDLVDFADKAEADMRSSATKLSSSEAARAAADLSGIDEGRKVEAAAKSLDAIGGFDGCSRIRSQMDGLRDALAPAEKMTAHIKELTGQFGPDSRMGKIAQQLSEQHRAIGALRTPMPLSDFEPTRFQDVEIPPNPIHETNDRLERIEQRFEQMLDVAANGATIATGLQAHAAEFLVKFEKAASENDRSAARAILLGAVAVLIALVMPLTQILYTELWRVPKDAAAMEAVITDMQTEIVTLRQSQLEAAQRISDALERSDQQLGDALRDIARGLASEPPESDTSSTD